MAARSFIRWPSILSPERAPAGRSARTSSRCWNLSTYESDSLGPDLVPAKQVRSLFGCYDLTGERDLILMHSRV